MTNNIDLQESKRKVFCLFNNEKIDLLEKSPIIPFDQVATLLSAEEMLKKAEDDALEYKKEVVVQCEQIKEQAYLEGYEKGVEEWSKKLLELDAHFIELQHTLEKSVLEVALVASRKILGRELEVDPKAFTDIILESLRNVSEHQRITIYVNKHDLQEVQDNRDMLRSHLERAESFIIKVRDDILKWGFVIETDRGIINMASPEKLWKPIEAMFAQMSQRLAPKAPVALEETSVKNQEPTPPAKEEATAPVAAPTKETEGTDNSTAGSRLKKRRMPVVDDDDDDD